MRPTRVRFSVLGVLLVTIFVAYLDRANISVLVAHDAFLREMGITGQPQSIGLLMSAFLFTYGISNVVLGPLGDYLGPRKAMAISISLWVIAMVMGGIVTTFIAMIASRVLLGAGEGIHYPMQSVFVKKWFPPRERGRANSVWLTGQSLASAAAMPFFAWSIASFGWRSSFFLCAALGLVPLYLLWFHTTDTPREHKSVNELELRYIESEPAPSVQAPAAAKESLWQNAQGFIGSYRYWVLVVYDICHSMVYWGLASWIPSYLKAARGFSWQQMGWIASLPFILEMVAKLAGGWLADRGDRGALICFVSMAGSTLSIYFGITVANAGLSAVLISMGVGMIGLGSPALWSMTQRIVPSNSIATASGLLNGVATWFGSLSPAIIGFCIALSGGSYAGGLYSLIATTVLGMVLAAVLGWQTSRAR